MGLVICNRIYRHIISEMKINGIKISTFRFKIRRNGTTQISDTGVFDSQVKPVIIHVIVTCQCQRIPSPVKMFPSFLNQVFYILICILTPANRV